MTECVVFDFIAGKVSICDANGILHDIRPGGYKLKLRSIGFPPRTPAVKPDVAPDVEE